METYVKKVEVRWSDLDPNFHMLHSKYYDLGAFCRMAFFVEHGMDPSFMAHHAFGPVLFREECLFKSEIAFGDDVSINLKLQKLSSDFSRWSMVHGIWKNTDIIAAIITIDAAWIDTQKRKLRIPPTEIGKIFEAAPRTTDFILYTK